MHSMELHKQLQRGGKAGLLATWFDADDGARTPQSGSRPRIDVGTPPTTNVAMVVVLMDAILCYCAKWICIAILLGSGQLGGER